MIPRYRPPLPTTDEHMLEDQAGRWCKVDDIVLHDISDKEEALIRALRNANFLEANRLYDEIQAERCAEDRKLVALD